MFVCRDPDALGNFCVFCEKICHHFRDTSAPGEFFFPPNFVKHYQTSQAPLSCFGAGQIFVRCENRTDFTICTAWSKEKVFKCAHDYQIENLAETNFVEIFGRAKQILSVQCVRTLMLHHFQFEGYLYIWDLRRKSSALLEPPNYASELECLYKNEKLQNDGRDKTVLISAVKIPTYFGRMFFLLTFWTLWTLILTLIQ